ncbi:MULTISPECIES: BTAD domain-containing putative transcriptional regulator [Micromonospora]|uniref:AfsR/SARP family transcriptional regulator n=1 Tax=Micromonospora solifontis TaxID=2487138 RepID=A0ABX9WJR0_9ACTN|nr:MULTISPECIES: BTAD domain-containing putative transcriptional regulator [Micromonospora]NES14114.1 AfsR/SARP family transcriptional regulator [Micromonospora sp. PPF5-17B]NES35744.1 AfsR/SARP family transcriptional regulator [Micromonospora solifontis]NES56009.1 AfsR/SARP family transcriptional regulator [Micromonospora sp. PPF5-6]RNM00418.1 AfsR/SARP family transcriptional regulator [Micromonospora solifontis]
MRISLLGPLELRADPGTPVEVGGARLRRLLILLALEPGRTVPVGRLADGVWDGDPPSGVANALQALVSRLRRSAPGLPVEARPGGYRLAVSPDDVDLHRFEAEVHAGRARLDTDPAGASRRLTEALALWRGPALAEVADADFARAPMARLTELRLAATEDLVAARLAGEAPDALLPELRELVAAHPLRERLAGLLIRALHRAGRSAEALAEYERLRATLADTLGIDPGPELAALHLEILRAGDTGGGGPDGPPGHAPAAGDAGATPGPVRGNLPAALTSFVGREEAVDRVGALLDGYRLVTLTGPGGAGKTRLAVESGRAVAGRFPDGVWLVELAPVTDPAEVPQAVLAALGLREQALLARGPRNGPEPVEPVGRLVEALAGRSALLLLDNCEHLLDAAAALAGSLLTAGPRLRVLATSREPLGVTGEAVRPVESLALPPGDADPATALAYPAVRLFADRAAAARADFTVDGATVGPVVRICRALDGMPLAIELAAARLRSLTAAQVDSRLDDRFRLLTGGSRTALPRHQTLRAVVDWSWDLLDDGERALWRRLAIFAGGATLDAAERVCGDGSRPGGVPDVLDRLAALVDKSLVVAVGDTEPRYRMLETIREYGLHRLAEAGEADRVRRAHATEYLALAEAAEPRLRTGEQLLWLRRLAADHDNLHAGLRHAVAAGDIPTAVRYAAALGWYWWLSGQRAEGAELAAQVLALPGVAGRAAPDRLAVALTMAALNLVSTRNDLATSLAWLERAAELAVGHESGHPVLRLVGLIVAAFRNGLPPRSPEELATLFDDPDPWVAGTARLFQAHAHLNAGLSDESAEADLRAALAHYRAVGDRWGMSFGLTSLADLLDRRGEAARATPFHEEALAYFEELGVQDDVPEMRLRLAHNLWRRGDHDRALAVLSQAEREAELGGSDETRAAVTHGRAEILRAQGDWAGARACLRESIRLVGDRAVAPQWRALHATNLAMLDAVEGDLVAARGHHDRALGLALGSQDAPVVGAVLVGFADLALRLGRPAAAARLLGAASGVRGGPDHAILDRPRVEAAARAALGEAGFAEAYAGGLGCRLETAAEAVRVTLDA